MKIVDIEDRCDALIERLVDVWESSVRATHLWLSDSDIAEIKRSVPMALREVPRLICCVNDDATPIGFIGVEGVRIEMLFILHEARGKGIGRTLIDFVVDNFSAKEVTVNEQNPEAVGFYEHMGFNVYKRSDYDEQGRAYPLLYMKR